MKFLGNWTNIENIILSEVTQSQKTWYILTDKWILGIGCGIHTIPLTDHVKLKRKKDQRIDASVLLRRGKIIKGSRRWEGLWRKRSRGGKKTGLIRYWWR